MSRFDEALNHLRQGLVVYRTRYGGTHAEYLTHHVVPTGEIIYVHSLSVPDRRRVWQPSQADILAPDWVLTCKTAKVFAMPGLHHDGLFRGQVAKKVYY